MRIAGYLRISVDTEDEKDDNVSIENQRKTILMYVRNKFPDAELDFYEDRDRSGYTFEQREDYMKMRPLLFSHHYDVLIVKDLSRFSRRNSRGLMELEDLRDCGMRIIAINDSIDYPTNDDWVLIQIKFFVNEMPVTDTSKKVRKVINMRQSAGEWICGVPYGYVLTNTKQGTFSVDEPAAEVVRKIFSLYLDGWGYKKIANYLTDLNIPTPRMTEKERKEADGSKTNIKARKEWSIITVQEILQNDFYIGTLRQHKYSRAKINGSDKKLSEDDHIVFENHHEPIIEYRVFAAVQEQMKQRSRSNYRGVRKYDTSFSGYLFCGDCGSPMFSMSRPELAPAYTCGTYHRRGLKGCTSHHTRVDVLTKILKNYVALVMKNSQDMIDELEKSVNGKEAEVRKGRSAIEILNDSLADAKSELKITMRQKIKEIQKYPERAELIEETYDELCRELEEKINGIEQQLSIAAEHENTQIKIRRITKTVLEIFDDILKKDIIDKNDLDLLIKRIDVYNDRYDIQLRDDIQMLLETGTISSDLLPDYSPKEKQLANFDMDIRSISSARVAYCERNRKGKAFDVNIVSEPDPLEIYTSNDGEVIFKKYSAVNEMAGSAAQVAEVMTKLANCPTVVFDRDHVVAVAGVQKKEFSERRVSQALEEYLENRKNYLYTSKNDAKVFPVEGIDRPAIACSPILASGDVTGAVAFLAPNNEAVANEVQQNLIQAAAQFLGKQIEE